LYDVDGEALLVAVGKCSIDVSADLEEASNNERDQEKRALRRGLEDVVARCGHEQDGENNGRCNGRVISVENELAIARIQHRETHNE